MAIRREKMQFVERKSKMAIRERKCFGARFWVTQNCQPCKQLLTFIIYYLRFLRFPVLSLAELNRFLTVRKEIGFFILTAFKKNREGHLHFPSTVVDKNLTYGQSHIK